MGHFSTARDLGASSYWKLSETTGTFADSIGAVTGTLSGTAVRGFKPGALYPWNQDACLDLDGSSGYVDLGDNFDFPGTAAFSVGIWVHPDTLGSGMRLVSKNAGIGSGGGWEIHQVSTTSTLRFLRSDSVAADNLDVTGILSAGSWTHVIATYDGATMTLDINGITVGSLASSKVLPGHAVSLKLGRFCGSATGFWNGKQDEPQIFPFALSPAQRLTLYNSRVVPAPSIEARFAWRPEQLNRVTNPGFETNTAGWAVTAGINGAGTSITRATADFHSGVASATLVCPATAETGGNYDFGAQSFFALSTYRSVYRFVLWAKHFSGTTLARLIVGSEGTSSDRAARDITLTTEWQPFFVDWAPSATRTDVQLAIVNVPAVAMTARLDDVAVYLRDAHTQVENGYFTVDTGGWSVGAGINAAGTSITRIASGGFYGDACAELVTTATSGSGTNFDLGTAKYTSGRTYRLRVYAKSVSGSTSARLRFGSLGTAGDRGDATITLTTSWALYTVDWTPSADRTDAELAISNGSAAIVTARLDGVEVYEALDDVSTDTFAERDGSAFQYGRGASFDGSSQAIGYANYRVVNHGKYTPENSAGALYGLLTTGKRALFRATYDGAPYALFYGVVRRFDPLPEAKACEIRCEDMLHELARLRVHKPHWQYSYHYSRTAALSANAIHAYSDESGPIESLTFNRGTDPVSVLDYFASLDTATGSLHFVQPQIYASDPWRIVFRDRTVHSDATTPSETWDDDLSDLSGYNVTDEAIINRQSVGLTAYRVESYNEVAQAYDPPTHSLIDDVDGKFYPASPELVTVTAPPEQMPLTIPANTRRVLRFEFSPMFLLTGSVAVTYASGSATLVEDYGPTYLVATLTAGSADAVISGITLSGYPLVRLPLNNEEARDEESIWLDGDHSGQDIDSPYVSHPAYAHGLAEWKVWRWKRARARPTILRENWFESQLGREVSDRVTVNFARLSLSGKVFSIMGFDTIVSVGSRQWDTTYQVEELPAPPAAGWFRLGTSELDGDAVLTY